jgi:flagellar basal body-associated protein FliL
MPEEIRINRPNPNLSRDSMVSPDMPPHREGSSKLPWIILAVVVVAIVVVGVLFRDKIFNSGSDNNQNNTTQTKPSGYQAVFLTNGQVYFGKMDDATGSYVTLTDIYYLQVTQPPLQGSQTTGQQQQQQQAQPQLSLVKLGNELHGPVDSMEINRDQILFYEDMKEDGKVMQAIREYQKNPPAANNQNPVK